MASEPDNQHIPGQWHGPLSLAPAAEVVRFVRGCDHYTRDLRARHGASVFKAHPGIKSTFVTDMAGLEYVFNAPEAELDRLDGEPGFGGLSFNGRPMLGGVVPALMAHGVGHRSARALVDHVLVARRDHFLPACEKVFRYGVPMLRGAARGVRVNFQHAVHHAVVGIAFEWLFGITPGPSGADAQSWIKGCFGLKSDQALANVVARQLSRRNGPTAAQRRYGAAMMEAIRGSKPYMDEFIKIAERVGVSERDLPAHLMFMASFNATGGAWATLHPALAQLSVDAVTRARLAAELAPFRDDLRALNRLPFLEDFFLESMRLYGRPRHYYRRALVDLTLPVGGGDSVPIKAGTTLCLIATVARQDRTVWGDDASIFDPTRFAREPHLRQRVYPLGPEAPKERNSFGCAGAIRGYASILWKSVAAALARSTDWKLSPWPEPDVDAFDGVRPGEFSWVRE